MLFKNLTSVIVGTSLLAFTISPFVNGLAQNNTKTQIIVSQINLEKPIPLADSLDVVNGINKNSEVTVSFNGRIFLEKIALPLNIQVQSDDTVTKLTQKWQEAKISQIESLILSKNKESEFLKTPIWYDSDVESMLENATLLNNIDLKNLEIQKLKIDQPSDILIESITINRSNQNVQVDEEINKIAQKNQTSEEKVDLTTAKKGDDRDEIIKPKMKLNSTAKIAKKSAKLETGLKQSNQTESSSQKITSNSNNFSSNSQAISQSQSSSFSSSASLSSTSSLAKTPKIQTVGDVFTLETITNTSQNESKISSNIVQKSDKENLTKNITGKKIAKIQTFKYQNPFYISPENEKKQKIDIESEQNKALEHNKKYKQTYLLDQYKEMLKSGTAPDPAIYQFSVEKNGREMNKEEIKAVQNEAKNAWIGPILGSIQTEARGLNNSSVPLLIYSWDNSNLTFDVPGGNTNNGTRLTIYGRQGGWNQTFSFDNSTNRISVGGKCLDIFGGVNSGAQVGLWGCHDGDNQKWIMIGTRLKPLSNQNYCVDASGGLNQGAQLVIWGCHDGGNQRFAIGDNNFGDYYNIGIAAVANGGISAGISGHALAYITKNGQRANTFSAWGNNSNDKDYDNLNSYVAGAWKTNNISTDDSIWVDRDYDWDISSYPPDYGYKRRYNDISKKYADYFRFGNGYRIDYVNQYMTWGNLTNSGLILTCATQASNVWNLAVDVYVSSYKVPYTSYPSYIYENL